MVTSSPAVSNITATSAPSYIATTVNANLEGMNNGSNIGSGEGNVSQTTPGIEIELSTTSVVEETPVTTYTGKFI